jgi:carbamoyl-phosphate synthase large subunit
MRAKSSPTDRKKMMMLGGGPNRIGQGIEFDYCCVHACLPCAKTGTRRHGQLQPETVSTDYDTSDRLYFEPLTLRTCWNIIDVEKPDGVLVQFGGQTPLNIARISRSRRAHLGTTVETIDLAEDRERFNALMRRLDISSPTARPSLDRDGAIAAANRIGYPVLVRPSYVLGGRGMAIVFDEAMLAQLAGSTRHLDGHPVLIDQFLDDAFEVDVDALGDGEHVTIGGIMQHIEEAGVHSGDSACVLPPYKISAYHLEIIREYTQRIGLALGVRGLFNIQFAIKGRGRLRAGSQSPRQPDGAVCQQGDRHPLASYAAQIAAGKTLAELGFPGTAACRWLFRQRGGAAIPEVPRR